jgi:hypothetical protein
LFLFLFSFFLYLFFQAVKPQFIIIIAVRPAVVAVSDTEPGLEDSRVLVRVSASENVDLDVVALGVAVLDEVQVLAEDDKSAVGLLAAEAKSPCGCRRRCSCCVGYDGPRSCQRRFLSF